MRSILIRAFIGCRILLLIALLAGGIAPAQIASGTITGTVTDSTGAALPAVNIVVTQTATNATYRTVTNNVGIYSIPGLSPGRYTIHMAAPGFSEARSSVDLIASQVQELNVRMMVGASTQTVSVNASPELLETETSNVANTLESEAITDLPLNATNGRDAMTLQVNMTPSMNKSAINGNEVYSSFYFAGANAWSNTVYVDGVDADAGPQGTVATPGPEALQEMQVQTSGASADLGTTGGGVLIFELKSGTNQIHGSAFEFLQNEALNANSWSNNYYLPGCAGNATCIQDYRRARDRFNDYGGSLGGPIWKKHKMFLFGDYEWYSTVNHILNANATTVPTAKMLTGDFSELLTGGTNQGPILNSSGAPIINPCTGSPYLYGQIFDPATQQVVSGQTCATPFAGNVIPASRLSPLSQSIAALYAKYYQPTITTRIYDNYPTDFSNTPSETKRSIDVKFDHDFSTRHHLSASYDYVRWVSTTVSVSGGLVSTFANPGPLSAMWTNTTPNFMARVIDSYTISPNLVNTVGVGYSSTQYLQVPTVKTSSAAIYGFNAGGLGFPVINYTSSNGVGEEEDGTNNYSYQNYYAYHYQDIVNWQKRNHSFKFGAYVTFQGLDSSYGGNIQIYNFSNVTGGPTSPTLTSWVGSAFANMMLGDVQSASQQVPYPTYPRQKYLTMFAQDDIKVNARLTANLGVLWDYTYPGHQQNGHWTNFDMNAQNPNWGTYTGAWTFARDSSSTFETENTLRQFAPHVGGAYQLSHKLIGRASYGLYYVPLSEFNTGFGYGAGTQQSEFWTATNTVPNSVVGATAFNWNNGYPGQNVFLARSISQTSFGYDEPFYINPSTLKLGHMQNFYAGFQYEIREHMVLDTRYVGTRGGSLHDTSESAAMNYPSFSTYSAVLTAGNINTTVSNAAQAAAINVPYPYPGFSGPAYAAIAPIPQAASYNNTTVYESDARLGASSYNSFVAEIRSRNSHGLNADLSYIISKTVGSNLSRRQNVFNGAYAYEDANDIPDSHHWVESIDQRNLFEGYLTYLLPFGNGQRWLSGSRALNSAAGGWTLGLWGSYGSGVPFGRISSPTQYPFFFGGQRDNFANGANARNLPNLFQGRHPDLANQEDPKNVDFPAADFATPAVGTLGNTPYYYNHWRWNTGAAMENAALTKAVHFHHDRMTASIRVEFYDLFNRHYINSPNTTPTSPAFGHVTGVSGTTRTGQLGARFQW